MVVVPYGAQIIPGKEVGVHHPSERLLDESSIRGLALFLGGHTQRTEDGPRVLQLEPAFLLGSLRHTPIDVPMPASNAEWHPLVELGLRCALRCGIHRARQHELS